MKAVILIGHGGVPKDFPVAKVGRLRMLESARQSAGVPPCNEERELDREIRNWPRTPESEPFLYGMRAIADGVTKKIGATRLEIAFNEFCAPSIEESAASLIGEGFTTIILLSTMITRGGIHSEIEIPEIIAALRKQYPGITFEYRWPLDADEIGSFFANQLRLGDVKH